MTEEANATVTTYEHDGANYRERTITLVPENTQSQVFGGKALADKLVEIIVAFDKLSDARSTVKVSKAVDALPAPGSSTLSTITRTSVAVAHRRWLATST